MCIVLRASKARDQKPVQSSPEFARNEHSLAAERAASMLANKTQVCPALTVFTVPGTFSRYTFVYPLGYQLTSSPRSRYHGNAFFNKIVFHRSASANARRRCSWFSLVRPLLQHLSLRRASIYSSIPLLLKHKDCDQALHGTSNGMLCCRWQPVALHNHATMRQHHSGHPRQLTSQLCIIWCVWDTICGSNVSPGLMRSK